MKKLFLLLFVLFSFKTFSQDLSDRIYTKEGDSILCKITLVKSNWIYYDHQGKKAIRNDYIHMSDLKHYLYNGVKRKAYEYEVKPVVLEQISIVDTTPKDTVKTFYLDNLSKKQTCFILLNKSKILNQINQFKKIEVIDSLGKFIVLLPNQISGYWLNGLFYRSFNVNHNKKTVLFFAEELVKGTATLYTYSGEQLDNKPIYIFKKQLETEYNFVQESISLTTDYGKTSNMAPQADGSPSGPGTITYSDVRPFLEYFQTYLSDCEEVLVKFKSNWYSYNDVRTMFTDYNNCK